MGTVAPTKKNKKERQLAYMYVMGRHGHCPVISSVRVTRV